MRGKANLEMTAADHESVGGTVPQILKRNPGKTLAETMDDQVLLAFICTEVEGVREVHKDIMAGAVNRIPLLETIRDGFLLPNIRYLKSIGRLPDEYSNVDFDTELAL